MKVLTVRRINRNMICTCCGSRTEGRQWWNQDKGYTLCPSCAPSVRAAEPACYDADHFERTYGREGEHYNV